MTWLRFLLSLPPPPPLPPLFPLSTQSPTMPGSSFRIQAHFLTFVLSRQLSTLLSRPRQDALERAHAQDIRGSRAEAAKLYQMGYSILAEGLALHVPSSGLSPQHSNVAKWRIDMITWQEQVSARYDPVSHVASLSCHGHVCMAWGGGGGGGGG